MGSIGTAGRVGLVTLGPVVDDGERPTDPAGATGLSRADRFQPLLLIASIGAGLGLAQLIPGVASRLGPLVDAAVFALIYLMMLGLDLGGLARTVTQRRFLAIAVALNFVMHPVLAFGLGQVFLADQPDLRVGLLLFLVTPCIGWYLIFTELAGGDTALGVGLLGINVVLQVLLLPLYLLVFEGQSTLVEVSGVVNSVLLFLVGPAALAVATRRSVDRLSLTIEDVQEVVDRTHVKTASLIVVIVAMFASQAQTIFDNVAVVGQLVAPMVAFFAIAFGVAIVAARLGRLPYEQKALLVFTTTSRNSEASLAIAATAFASPLVALTVVIGPVIELPLLVLMVRLLRGRFADQVS